jgi:hypothetical protein
MAWQLPDHPMWPEEIQRTTWLFVIPQSLNYILIIMFQ